VEPTAPRQLRMALVDDLRAKGSVRSAAVEAAMRAVPRHVFLPGAPLEQAHTNDALVTKGRAADGSSLTLIIQVARWLGRSVFAQLALERKTSAIGRHCQDWPTWVCDTRLIDPIVISVRGSHRPRAAMIGAVGMEELL
jgi:hypothetical protein